MNKYILGVVIFNIICCIILYYMGHTYDKKYEALYDKKTISNRILASIIITIVAIRISTSSLIW